MTMLKRRFTISNNKFKSLIKASLSNEQQSSGLVTVAEEIKSAIDHMLSLKESHQFKDIDSTDFNWLYGQVVSLQKKINKTQIIGVNYKKDTKVPVSVCSDKPIIETRKNLISFL